MRGSIEEEEDEEEEEEEKCVESSPPEDIFFKIGQCLYFSFLTHTQCIKCQEYTTALLCFH
jgi:hypothetical protein